MLALIRSLVAGGKARFSEHGFVKLRENGINLSDLVRAVGNAEVVEDYPDYHKGPCVLVLYREADGRPVHALWGTARSQPDEATLITAYRPDPARWSKDFLTRRPK